MTFAVFEISGNIIRIFSLTITTINITIVMVCASSVADVAVAGFVVVAIAGVFLAASAQHEQHEWQYQQ